MGIIGLILSTISAALAITRWWRRRREEREAFNRMGTFFTSEELKKKPLEPETVGKVVSSLLKCSPAEWNEEFYWTHRADRVREVLEKHGRVLILGPAGIGKSRTVIEVLRAIFREDKSVGKALVIVLSKKDISELNRLPVPKWCLKGYDLVVLLLDDLNIYVRILRVRELIGRFEEAVKKVWLVATCRTEVLEHIEEDPEISGLFGAGPEARRELRVEMSLYTLEEGREIARLAGKEFREEEFDGTIAPIILGTHRKKEHYDKLAREGRVAELDVLHALKLLRLSRIPFPRVKLVRLVWTKIFGHPEGEWAICYSRVRALGFFLPFPPPPSEPEVLLMHDVFVRKIITLYPPPGVSPLDHMASLAGLLQEAEAWGELLSLGVALGLRGHHDEALRCFDAVIKGMPEPPAEAYFNRGVAWYHKGEYDRAIQDYTKAIELKPDDAEAYYNRGLAWDELGDFDRAIQDFDRAIELKPDYAEAYNNRGNAWAHKGEYDRAIQDFDKAIELKPDDAEAYFNRGNAWAHKGEYDRAIQDFDKAIELKPDFAEAYNNRGNAWDELGEYDRAIQDYTKAIELKPDDAEAYNNRGVAWAHKGDYDRALEDFEVAWSLRHKLPDKGARIPLGALLVILRAISEGVSVPEPAETLATWLGRAEEIYDLLPEEGKRLMDELREKLSRRSPREPGVGER